MPAIYAGIAGIELMREIGIAETREHVNALNEQLIAGVDELGGTVVTPREPERRGALVCIRSTDAPALVAALGGDGIVTSERDSNLRVSAARLQHRGRHRRRPRRPREAPAPAGVGRGPFARQLCSSPAGFPAAASA